MVAKCCGSIVGCQECVGELSRREDGQESHCPLCRASDFDCMKLNGLDGFLLSLTESLSQRSENSETA